LQRSNDPPTQSVGSPPAAHGGEAPLPSAEFLFTSSALTTAVLGRTILVTLVEGEAMSDSDKFLEILVTHIAEEVAEKVAQRLRAQLGNDRILFSIDETAKRMGISKSSLKNMLRNREIACVRRGSRVLIHRKEIDDWVARNRV
jgi:excisionase family DNA binding protein